MPWKCPPPPKPLVTPLIADAVENMKLSSAVLVTWNGNYSKERCLDKIRIAETYLAIAKEKLEKM